MKINIKRVLKFFFTSFIIIHTFPTNAQERKLLTIDEAVQLALQNHPQLQASKTGVEIGKQQITIAELQRVPTLTFSTTASYMGNLFTLDKHFGNKTDIDIPNFGNTFGLQAGQLLFKGGLIKKSIEAADLRAQLSELDLEKDKQSIKFLVISNYLDIVQIDNQIEVLNNNKQLAETRLKNIKDFYSQGMVTRNEVIRGELAIQNINQALLTANNNRKIINYQLNVAIGLPTETIIQPSQTSAIMANGESLDYYFNVAFESNPFIQSSQKNILLASKNVDIIKTDLLPGISAVGGYNMQRPLTSSIPASDLYLNAWQVGLSLNFSIDNLFKTKERIKSGKLVEKQAQQVLEVVKQNIATGINAAYVKYQEAIAQSNLAKEAKRLADENYKIIEAKYLNQLVVQAEMIDAQNQKIQSDIDYSNSLVNISFQYYNLIKATGTL